MTHSDSPSKSSELLSEPFHDVFLKLLHNTRLKLESYLADPTAKNIHHARISIRRLESAYNILSKSDRTKKSNRIISLYGDFFSQNNIIRDYDIILQKLTLYGCDPNSIISLDTERKKLKKLLKTLPMAKKLLKLKKPKFKKTKPAISRLQKKTLFLVKKFNNYIHVVTSNENHIDELHSMRKTAKKLRYLLELYPKGTHDNLLSNIKSLQRLLGDIHDCDVFISYLEKHAKKSPGMSDIILSEKKKRSDIYKDMVYALGT
ncbi:MAG: CHAD domain-containing protein [Thaumarchaeota archaeon]|nr:CHAD domain-containing protein [Nitrososphaerota archaeon]